MDYDNGKHDTKNQDHMKTTTSKSLSYYCFHDSLLPVEISCTQITDDIIYKDDTILHKPNEITIWNLDYYIFDPWISNEFIHSASISIIIL